MTTQLTTTSYKRSEYKRGYLRVNGTFADEVGSSKNHRRFSADVSEGDSIDARGSEFLGGDGRSRWSAPRGQWVRLTISNGQLAATDFDGNTIPTPSWVRLEVQS